MLLEGRNLQHISVLNWTELRATFRSHDLEGLLVHGGLESRIQVESDVLENFKRITGIWIVEGKGAIRYQDPSKYTKENARVFLDWIKHRREGVVPWLKKQI